MKKNHTMEMIFPELLFVIFSLCSLFLLTTGVMSYQKFNQQNDSDVTTALAYINTKVNTNNHVEAIDVTTIDQTPCLTIDTIIDTVSYKTYIYVYEEQLLELWIPESETPHLVDGTPIMNMKSLNLSINDRNLILEATDSNNYHKQLTLYLKGGVL